MSVRSLRSLHENILVSLHADVSGHRPMLDEVYRIALLPLDEHLAAKGLPFYHEMKPRNPELADPKVIAVHKQSFSKICREGEDQDSVKGFLMGWFNSLGLVRGRNYDRKIILVTYDYDVVKPCMLKWLGDDYYKIFHNNVRDLRSIIGYLNDVKGFGNQHGDYIGDSLNSVRDLHKVSIPTGNPLQWAQIYATCYRHLLGESNLF
jgi:hypothetical protein